MKIAVCTACLTSFLVCMGDVSAAVELHAVRCVTGTIHAVMNRAGWGVPLPVVCKICQQDWHFDDGYLKRHPHLWESRIICLVLLKTLGDTAQGSYSPPTVQEQKPMSEVSLR